VKRAKHLYPLIAAPENLKSAFVKAARGKREYPEVIAFSRGFDRNIAALQRQLQEKDFDIGHYHFFVVRDPKVRAICAAAFPERVLHHAIMNVCEPEFEKRHIHDSYACRRGKGNLRAVVRAQQFARRNRWYLKLDIRKYFDCIDHETSMELLERAFHDADLLFLFRKILATYHTAPGKGIPIGNLFSQHLANFYLSVLDHRLKEARNVKCYLRYMDDFMLFSPDKQRLLDELHAIRDFLRERLHLELKNSVQLNQTRLGAPFLGHRIFPAHTRLLSGGLLRFSRRYREYERNYCEGVWSEKELARRMEALQAFVCSSDSLRFRKHFIGRFGVLS
jgi:hypothetical protein